MNQAENDVPTYGEHQQPPVDDVVPVKHAEKLFKHAGEPKKLVILEGAGHRLRLEERAVSTALEWLQQIAELTPI